MHHPTDRIIHTTAFVTPVVEHWLEREIANTLTTELHLAPVWEMMHIKDPLLLIGMSTPCWDDSGFPHSVSGL